MRQLHEISPAWRGAPWNRRRRSDWDETPEAEPEAPHFWVPLGLAVALGLALGATVVAGLARQDRARFEALMASVNAGA